jgi:murein DD-endopeptidase MepM/ murein hydrolase activator NlpD
VEVAPRGKGFRTTRLPLCVATAMAIALSLSGLALANERRPPASQDQGTHAVTVTATPIRVPLVVEVTVAPHVPIRRHLRSRAGHSPHAYVLPVARRLISRSQLDRPHHDYPAWDLGVPIGTRVVASRGGLVEEVTQSGNCGNGVIVIGTDGYTYTYCHGSSVRAHPGDEVRTGQKLMLSGESGHATGPHLHFQIESPSGLLLCPQSLVTSWFNGGEASPATATSTGCFYATRHPEKPYRPRRRHHSHRAGTRARPKPRTPKPTPTPSPSPSPTLQPSPTPSPTPSPSPTPTPLPSLT